MKTLIKASAAVVAAVLFGACNSAQPIPPCAVGHGGYAAELIKTSGPATGACVRTGDIIGVQKYRQADGSQDIYLKPEAIAFWDWYDEVPATAYTSLAQGTLAENVPSGDGYCSVSELSVATGETFLGENLSYTFTNVDFYVQGSVPGTQFRADLTIVDLDDPTCTATYDVRAMYPVVFCNDFSEEATTPGEPNAELCKEVDHTWSYVAANPLFNTKCQAYGNPGDTAADHDWLTLFEAWAGTSPTPWQICVPAAEIPSLVAGAN